ncbi:hypothetical protein EB052_01030 [bacterium]|nr:hypothetical protein [bacterium]
MGGWGYTSTHLKWLMVMFKNEFASPTPMVGLASSLHVNLSVLAGGLGQLVFEADGAFLGAFTTSCGGCFTKGEAGLCFHWCPSVAVHV